MKSFYVFLTLSILATAQLANAEQIIQADCTQKVSENSDRLLADLAHAIQVEKTKGSVGPGAQSLSYSTYSGMMASRLWEGVNAIKNKQAVTEQDEIEYINQLCAANLNVGEVLK